ADKEEADEFALFGACVDQPIEKLLEALAVFMAEAIDLSHEGVTREDQRLQQVGDALAAALNLDMSKHWEADAEFWSSAPKAFAIAALATTPAVAALDEKARTDKLSGFQKMKKADLARAAVQTLKGTGWLPDVLITRFGEGAHAVTTAGKRAL